MPRKVVRVSLQALALGACLALAFGCGRESAATQEIRSAASVDLDCDPAMIELVEDKPMEKRVTGCGRTLTYMHKCNATAGGGSKCQWRPVTNDSNRL